MIGMAALALCLGIVNAIDWLAVREALEHAGYTLKEACHDMRIDRSQFERQLAGEGHLSLTRLQRLRPVFWQWFAIAIAKRVGVPEEMHIARQVADAINERRVA